MPFYNIRQYTSNTYLYVEAPSERVALAIAHAAPAEAWNWEVDEEEISEIEPFPQMNPINLQGVSPEAYQAALDEIGTQGEEEEEA